EANEKVVNIIPVREFIKDQYITFITKQGMVKKTELEVYQSPRYSRSLIALNLRDNDELVNAFVTDGEQDVFIATHLGYGLWFSEQDISVVGQRALGVIGIQLKDDDYVVNGVAIDESEQPNLIVATQRGAAKRMKLSEFEKSTRARRGTIMRREINANPARMKGLLALQKAEQLIYKADKDQTNKTIPFEMPLSDRNSNGSCISDIDEEGSIKSVTKEVEYEQPFVET